MKTLAPKPNPDRGSVLVVTMSIIAVLALSITAYLLVIQNETAAVARSQTWNSTVPVAEAGVEEGLALVNLGAPDIIDSAWAWTNAVATNIAGWSSWTNGYSYLTRTVSSSSLGSNYYTVSVCITGSVPVISSVGFVPLNTIPWIYTSARNGAFVAAAGVNMSSTSTTTQNSARKLQIQTILQPLFPAAITTRSNFNMNGNNATVDSFDSSTSLYSTGGNYDASKRRANGDVATDSSIIGDVNVGNGNIYGHVMTGPGTVQNSVQIGPNGSVGDLNWVGAGTSGIESNFWSGDYNINIPDVNAPNLGGTNALPTASNNVVTITGGTYVLSTSATGLNKPWVITGPTTMWVQGGLSVPNITITNSGSLVLYLGTTTGSGDSLDIAGNQNYNSPGISANFQIYGLPSLTSLTMHGNAAFAGTIYAPDAAASYGGGGNNTTDISGATVLKSLTLNGHWNFHYDEHLKLVGPNRGWIAQNWTELKYP